VAHLDTGRRKINFPGIERIACIRRDTHTLDAFRRLDRDGSGKITKEEFRTAITEFYLSDDENAPGNWLLGPMGQPA
jgi:hypothetical protein